MVNQEIILKPIDTHLPKQEQATGQPLQVEVPTPLVYQETSSLLGDGIVLVNQETILKLIDTFLLRQELLTGQRLEVWTVLDNFCEDFVRDLWDVRRVRHVHINQVCNSLAHRHHPFYVLSIRLGLSVVNHLSELFYKSAKCFDSQLLRSSSALDLNGCRPVQTFSRAAQRSSTSLAGLAVVAATRQQAVTKRGFRCSHSRTHSDFLLTILR